MFDLLTNYVESVHCVAHSLALVVKYVLEPITPWKNYMNHQNTVWKYFYFNFKAETPLQEMRKEMVLSRTEFISWRTTVRQVATCSVRQLRRGGHVAEMNTWKAPCKGPTWIGFPYAKSCRPLVRYCSTKPRQSLCSYWEGKDIDSWRLVISLTTQDRPTYLPSFFHTPYNNGLSDHVLNGCIELALCAYNTITLWRHVDVHNRDGQYFICFAWSLN